MDAVAPPTPAGRRIRPHLIDAAFLFFFRRRLRARLRRYGRRRASALTREATARAEALLDANQHRLVDRASESHLWMAGTVTAAYQVLLAHPTTNPDALDIVREVFLETGAKGTEWLMRLLPRLVKDPFRFTVEVSKKKQADYYGRTFERVVEQDDQDAYRMTVTRCFYHRFLVDHGVAELGPAFCEKDFNWAGAIDPDTHGFAFSRPTTLLTGGRACPFEMRRAHRLPVWNDASAAVEAGDR